MDNIENKTRIGMLSTAKDPSLVEEVVKGMELEQPLDRYEMVVIPTAGNEKGRENNTFLEAALDAFKIVGFNDIKELDIQGKKREEVEDALISPHSDGKPRIAVISGGNSYFLRHHLEESGADDVIKQEVQSGRLAIVTISAGSTNMGQTLALAGSGNEIGLSHTSGVGLVDFGVVCHFSPEKEQELKAKLEDASLAASIIVTLTNKQGLVGKGNDFRVIGGDVTIFEKKPGENFYNSRITNKIPPLHKI